MKAPQDYVKVCQDRVFGKENRFYLMGVAIFWIFFYHFYCWFKGNLPWWIYFFSEGQTGVDIFLFLSAYGLEASLRKNRIMCFYKNRIKRLFPVYFLFLAVVFCFYPNTPLYSILIQCLGQLTGFSLIQVNSFFSTNFEFDWFTPALIVFYISFPLLSITLNKISKESEIIEFFSLIAVIILSLLSLREIQLPIKSLIYRLPIIMLGIFTYIHLSDQKYNRLISIYLLAFIGGLFSNQHWFLSSTSIPIAFLALSLTDVVRPLYHFFSLLGRHSYEIYLAHIFPVTNFFMLNIFNNIYIHILITIIWTIIVATIFSYVQKIYYKTINKIRK
ncbi:acyltransferase family protein [Prevotella sp. RM4]|uniref:acyltransferase family protein n=1 Tax=Prevotella sp. RM4 TaxID=1200547 RepID=UPI00051BD883